MDTCIINFKLPDLYVPIGFIDSIYDRYIYFYGTSDGFTVVAVNKENNTEYFQVSASYEKGGIGWVPSGIANDMIAELNDDICEYLLSMKSDITTTDRFKLLIIELCELLLQSFSIMVKDVNLTPPEKPEAVLQWERIRFSRSFK